MIPVLYRDNCEQFLTDTYSATENPTVRRKPFFTVALTLVTLVTLHLAAVRDTNQRLGLALDRHLQNQDDHQTSEGSY